ncbi:MAG: hypothetical protein ACYCY2_00170 [Acidithiobacillus ferriphilus]
MSQHNEAVNIVSDFLAASMVPDPEKAATFLAEGVQITFTGRRLMPDAQAITMFNKARYAWVKKSFGHFDWMERDAHCFFPWSLQSGIRQFDQCGQ